MPRFELPSPSGQLQTAIQMSIDLVSFGLQAADRLEVETLEIPGMSFRLIPAQNRAMKVDEAREEFRVWVLANGLRDCVDAIGPSLEWARKTCFVWSRLGEVSEGEESRLSGQVSGKDWNAHVVEEAKRFDRWPLRKKLAHLRDEYHLPQLELSDAILSINYARNCLTHRRGIVGPEDIRDQSAQGLLVRWRKPQLLVKGDGGIRVVEPPAQVQKGEMCSVRFVDVCKEFALEDRVRFSPTEFVEISTTFFLFGRQIEEAIHALQRARRPVSN